jgi:hypothetical protein
MPTISSTSLLSDIFARNVATPNSTITESHDATLKVICAWPVSGQYGPGSRVLQVPRFTSIVDSEHEPHNSSDTTLRTIADFTLPLIDSMFS